MMEERPPSIGRNSTDDLVGVLKLINFPPDVVRNTRRLLMLVNTNKEISAQASGENLASSPDGQGIDQTMFQEEEEPQFVEHQLGVPRGDDQTVQ